MILPILLAVCAAQKHRNRSMPEITSFEKRVGLHSCVFRTAVVHALDLPLVSSVKPLWSAKVRLTSWVTGKRGSSRGHRRISQLAEQSTLTTVLEPNAVRKAS